MSQCKKFVPNIFHKTKCSNCFRQKEEHSAEALECNRASRSVARSGYLFVAPDWDFSVPLNRTKRWQRRWFVLYDDGELNYSVDEHPDTVPQGSVDMSKVLEVTGAEQVTGHPHSLALTGPDRVTFVKAASREDARWWAELLAVFPRRHKRNATFPGGRASPSLPQLGRSASPQPPRPRPRHLSCTGPSPRANFTTPPLREEREPPKEEAPTTPRPVWLPRPTTTVPIETLPRTGYLVSSGSPPTRDKLRCDEKSRARRDWRHERLRDIATDIITDRSPESSLALPAEGVLNLKKGWLWCKADGNDWRKRWWVLCGPTLTGYQDQDEQSTPEVTVELSSVTRYSETQADFKYGFRIEWSGPVLTLSAVTSGIRSNWLQALKKAAPCAESPPPTSTPRALFLSSDEEYRTASEGGRRDSEDWSEVPPSPPLSRGLSRARPKLPRCQSRQNTADSVSTDELDTWREPGDEARIKGRPKVVRCSRQSTLDSVSTDELDACKGPEDVELRNVINRQTLEIENLKRKCCNAEGEIQNLEVEISRLKKAHNDLLTKEIQLTEMLTILEASESDTKTELADLDEKHAEAQRKLEKKLAEAEKAAQDRKELTISLQAELRAKEALLLGLQKKLTTTTDCLTRSRLENERLAKKLQETDSSSCRSSKRIDSLTDLTNIDLETDLDDLSRSELVEQCLDLRGRFEKAVLEIRAVKRELRESYAKFDRLELDNAGIKRNLEIIEEEAQSHAVLMANRVQDLTNKLAAAERQARNLKAKLQHSRGKRRSLSLKGRENFSINKEVEDKVNELEAKILALESGRARRKHKRDRSQDRAASPACDDRPARHHRRKSLDSATTSEPMKLLMRLSSLEGKICLVSASNESLNTQSSLEQKPGEPEDCGQRHKDHLQEDHLLKSVQLSWEVKVRECLECVRALKAAKAARRADILADLERLLTESRDLFASCCRESQATSDSAGLVVQQLVALLGDKIHEVNARKAALRAENRLTDRAALELFAEKIAFENVLISRVRDALETPPSTGETRCERFARKELLETEWLIKSLRQKLNTTSSNKASKSLKEPLLRTSAAYLTRVLARRLLLSAPTTRFLRTVRDTAPLTRERSQLNAALDAYKSKKLPLLAEALANEALALAADNSCRLSAPKTNDDAPNNRKWASAAEDLWKTARETVNAELIQAEISHALSRAAQLYENASSADQRFFFTFFAAERAALELWADAVESRLRTDMDQNLKQLQERFKDSLAKLQRPNWRRRVESERSPSGAGALLAEFADVLAHKALVDARIAVLTEQPDEPQEEEQQSLCLRAQELLKLDNLCSDLDELGLVDGPASLDREFRSMLERKTKDCVLELDVGGLVEVREALRVVAEEVCELERLVGEEQLVDCCGLDEGSVTETCRFLQGKLLAIRRALLDGGSHFSFRYGTVTVDEHVYLSAEYVKQVEQLRSAHRRALAECEGRKQQEAVEQLQALCERALAAMEHWHRRALRETRAAHAHELDVLRQDKEQALAEETQATLAALDAMRKAHEADVKREVAKFKEEFARRQQGGLLQLSERLSVKCLEAAALEEQLGSTARQLAHAQQHILQLERNPQLSMQN